MCGCTEIYYIKWYLDPCTDKWIKSHPHVIQILSPRMGFHYDQHDSKPNGPQRRHQMLFVSFEEGS
jgi:hypothetical protein